METSFETQRLLSAIRTNLNNSLQEFMFEPNDETTQNQIATMLSKYFELLQDDESIVDYKVVCDATNNPPSSVDQNRLLIDIYVQPGSILDTVFEIKSMICPTDINHTENNSSSIEFFTKENHYADYERAMLILGKR